MKQISKCEMYLLLLSVIIFWLFFLCYFISLNGFDNYYYYQHSFFIIIIIVCSFVVCFVTTTGPASEADVANAFHYFDMLRNGAYVFVEWKLCIHMKWDAFDAFDAAWSPCCCHACIPLHLHSFIHSFMEQANERMNAWMDGWMNYCIDMEVFCIDVCERIQLFTQSIHHSSHWSSISEIWYVISVIWCQQVRYLCKIWYICFEN